MERLKRVDFYLERLLGVLETNRLDVFAANCFVIMVIGALALILLEYAIAMGVIWTNNPGFFEALDVQGDIAVLDFLRASLNNLPLGGSQILKGTSLASDLFLFSERFVVTLVLGLAIFSYSTFSSLQLSVEKERLASWVKYRRKKIEDVRAAYYKVRPTDGPTPSGRKRRRRRKRKKK